MSPCPCGSGLPRDECCRPLIDGEVRATTAEALMRARYVAHAEGRIDFILKTHHPATRADVDEVATARWAEESEWLGLEIRDIEGGDEQAASGRVEFIAAYRDAAGRRHHHHEVSLFEKYHGQWFFRDAELPTIEQFVRDRPKQGRNEPCACGSGLKYKKCCGQAA